MMNINQMTRKEFEQLPYKKWGEEIECDSLIIIPGRAKDLHYSKYRCMSFVAAKNNKPICLIDGGSDVLHIDGIGGYGYKWFEKGEGVPHKINCSSWSIDCLPKSGLLRMFAHGKIICGHALSNFEIFCIRKEA